MQGNYSLMRDLILTLHLKIKDWRKTMTILEEIREGFASMTTIGAMKINNLAEEYAAKGFS